MGHEEAVQKQSVEKYLLGQMPAEERNRFEEHFFECAECGEDIRLGILLMDNAAAEFTEPAPRAQAAATSPPKRSFWKDWLDFGWRQPAFAAPTIALFLVSTFWILDHASLREQMAAATGPQVITTEQLDVTRGETPIAVNRKERFLAFSFYIDADKDTLPDYVIEIGGNGVAKASVPVPQRTPGKSYEVLLPTARYQPGVYDFTVRGGPDTDGRIVKQFERKLN